MEKNPKPLSIALLVLLLLISFSATTCTTFIIPGECPDAVSSPVVDIDQLLATTPDFAYDFESGWNASAGSGDLSNANPAAPAWR